MPSPAPPGFTSGTRVALVAACGMLLATPTLAEERNAPLPKSPARKSLARSPPAPKSPFAPTLLSG